MGLYNVIFGQNDSASDLLEILLDRQPFEVGRFRDAWVERLGDAVAIRIHTRNGGGNRPDYQSEIASMRRHPWYLRDQDGTFDSTYADFWFQPDLSSLDPDQAETLLGMAVEPVDMDAEWKAAINDLKTKSPEEWKPSVQNFCQKLGTALTEGGGGIMRVGPDGNISREGK